jgi:hypothetical protein
MRPANPLPAFGLEVVDLRWTLKDIDSKRTFLITKDHIPKLIELGLVELREDGVPSLTQAGKTIAWDH